MSAEPSALDRTLAKICELCPVCLHARYYQKGMGYEFVKNVEQDICPFCKAYERVHGNRNFQVAYMLNRLHIWSVSSP